MSSIPSDGSFFEQFQRLQAEKAEKEGTETTSRDGDCLQDQGEAPPPLPPSDAPDSSMPTPPDAPEPSDSDFIPSASFTGSRPGFIFKKGEQGLGKMLTKTMQTPIAWRRNNQFSMACRRSIQFPYHAGYHKDIGLEGWLKAKQDLAKAKPTAIKANKSIVKIPSRGGGAGGEPSAKKAKTGVRL